MGKHATFIEQGIRRICEANTWTIGALITESQEEREERHKHVVMVPEPASPTRIAV